MEECTPIDNREAETLQALEAPKLIPIRDVLRIVPISRITLLRLRQRGEFPKPVRLGRQLLYVEAEVREWFRDRLENRNGEAS